MANFEKCLEKLLLNEGGYVHDPDDSGGETYKGIARNMNQKWQGWPIIDKYKLASNLSFPKILDSDINLQTEIKRFYMGNYWDAIRGTEIVSNDIAFQIFDFAVNAGVKTSIKAAQMCYFGLVADGIIGVSTLMSLNDVKASSEFLNRFKLQRIEHYLAICKKKPLQRKFLYSWVNRTLET
jgi:lysozyme family protein